MSTTPTCCAAVGTPGCPAAAPLPGPGTAVPLGDWPFRGDRPAEPPGADGTGWVLPVPGEAGGVVADAGGAGRVVPVAGGAVGVVPVVGGAGVVVETRSGFTGDATSGVPATVALCALPRTAAPPGG